MGWTRDLHHHLSWGDKANSTGSSVWACPLQTIIANAFKYETEFPTCATKVPNRARCKQNCMSSHMKTISFPRITSKTCNHHFHISRFSLKSGNTARRTVAMSEKISWLMHITTRVGQRILSNPVHQRIFRAEWSALGTSEGLLDSCGLILPKKKHWKSPEVIRHSAGQRPWQYRTERKRMELHKVDVSTFCYRFFCLLFCLCNPNSQYLQMLK